MKKFISQCVVAALCLFVVSCSGGGGSSPTDVAKKVCSAMVSKDAKGVAKYVHLDQDTKESDAVTLIKEILQWKAPAKYEIKSEKIAQDGNSAKVYIKFTFKDGEVEDTDLEFTKTDQGWKMELTNGF